MNDLRFSWVMTMAAAVFAGGCAGGGDMRGDAMGDADLGGEELGSTGDADVPGGEGDPVDDDAVADDGAPGTDGDEPDEDPELPGDETGGGSTGGQEPDGGTTGAEDPTEGETGEVDPTDGETGEVDPTEGETGETGEPPPPMAELDGDNAALPAVIALFRATSGAPVSVDAPIVGQVDPLDVRGLEYVGAVSEPGDGADWVQFSIVPGQVDPTITIELLCEQDQLSPQPLRATLLDEDDAVIDTFVCGEGPQNVTLQDASSFDEYRVRVDLVSDAHYDEYRLQIDAFCFPTCDFQPYAG